MTAQDETQLSDLRQKIDAVDDRLVDLLGERLDLVHEVGAHKSERSIRDPQREGKVLARLMEQADLVGIDATFLERLFTSVFDESLRTQERRLKPDAAASSSEAITVAYQGVGGAYSELAVRRHTGGLDGATAFKGFESFAGVIDAVQTGTAVLGCLPIENTTTGSIAEVHDLILESDLSIVGEEVVDVAHCLLGVEPVPVAELRRVLSHPQALAQCSRFLSGLVDCEVVPYTDTAGAARTVAEEGDAEVAALASEEAGRRYGLVVLRRNVSDREANLTRFCDGRTERRRCRCQNRLSDHHGGWGASRVRGSGPLPHRAGRVRAQPYANRVETSAQQPVAVHDRARCLG